MYKLRVMDITMKTQYLTSHIRLSRFNPKAEEAQKWLDRAIMRKMTPYVPKKTGVFLSKIKAENRGMVGTGHVKTAVPPQGRYLYPGIAPSGRMFNWTNPQTQPRWGRYTWVNHKEYFLKGARKILMKGEKKSGGS